jgi:hypothetical protein
MPFKKVFMDQRATTLKKEHLSASMQRKGCPLQAKCLGKTVKEKKFSVTY